MKPHHAVGCVFAKMAVSARFGVSKGFPFGIATRAALCLAAIRHFRAILVLR